MNAQYEGRKYSNVWVHFVHTYLTIWDILLLSLQTKIFV
jgi:hypothetical protein